MNQILKMIDEKTQKLDKGKAQLLSDKKPNK